jgi:hypothetical protein
MEEDEHHPSSLRNRYRRLYQYASKMIKLIQSKTPLIVYFSPLARARLMNDGRKGVARVPAIAPAAAAAAAAASLCSQLTGKGGAQVAWRLSSATSTPAVGFGATLPLAHLRATGLTALFVSARI